jgi:hypothetical protein
MCIVQAIAIGLAFSIPIVAAIIAVMWAINKFG